MFLRNLRLSHMVPCVWNVMLHSKVFPSHHRDVQLHSSAFVVWCVLPLGWACWLFEFRVRSSRTSTYLHGPLSFSSRAFTPHHSGLWKFSGPAFHLVSKFSSLCFLLGSSHHCIFKSADSFPCNEQPTANPSLLCLISDATALLSNAHSVFCVVSESSLKNFWTYGAQLW